MSVGVMEEHAVSVSQPTHISGQSVSGKQVTVLGAARSGVAATELLCTHGAKVFVSDSGNAVSLATSIARLKELNIPMETGRHTERVLEADLIVVSPGVPHAIPVLADAARSGIPVISEIELASWFCDGPIIAVTGTNGKTTTTVLTGRMLHDARKKHVVAGNIGTSFSSVIKDIDAETTVVLEVSSFQLETIDAFRPHISVLLNITPDHLDRYDGIMERYIDAKCRVFENQTMEDVLVYNADDVHVRECAEQRASHVTRCVPLSVTRVLEEGAFVADGSIVIRLEGQREEVVTTDQISIKGVHNLYNSMAATLAGRLMGISVPSLRATLRNFKGVEHRLEFVRDLDGVTYVNDSKATNVDSVWYALQAYDRPIILLLGGRDKGNDYGKLRDLVSAHVKTIIALGESADKVIAAFRDHVQTRKASTMEEAVTQARSSAAAGDIVLLSPACASFDWFQNYEHRGKVFKQHVMALQ